MLCYSCMRKVEESDKECPFCGEPFNNEVPVHLLTPGTVLQNRYIVGKSLGEGGFGITYIGLDQKLQLRVAIKEYYPTGYVNRNSTASATVSASSTDERREFFDQGKDKFLTEARVLAKFSKSAGIVEVRDTFEENNTAYIIMEYLDGITLKDHINECGGKIAPQKTFELLKPVIDSLKDVHKQNIIHRDISPDNIMIADGKAKLLDFGSARAFSNAGNQSLSIMLKHGYAPIEQYSTRGKQGPWTDTYGLCATIYKCVTGVTPDDAVDRQISDNMRAPSALGIEIDEVYETALMKGLSVQYTDRFQSVDELLDGFNGKIKRSADDKQETVAIPKPELQNSLNQDDYKKTESLFKPDREPVSGLAAFEDNSASKTKKSEPSHADGEPSAQPALLLGQPTKSAVSPTEPTNSDTSPAEKTAFLFKPDAAPADNLTKPTENKDDGSEKTEFLQTSQTDESAQKAADAVVPSADSESPKRKKLKYIIGLAASAGVFCIAVILAIVLPKIGNRQAMNIEGETVSSSMEESVISEPVSSSTVNANGGNAPVSSSTTTTTSSSSKPVSSSTTTTTSSSSTTSTTSSTPTAVPVEPTETYVTILGKSYDISTTTVLDINSGSTPITDEQFKSIMPEIEKLTNLKELYLTADQISDMTPISSLTNLTKLYFVGTQVTDLTPIANLKGLSYLDLRFNQISDLTPLANLTNLTYLDLGGNPISDIKPLANLSNLSELKLWKNPLSDIKPIANLTNLKELYLDENQISDITPLSNLINLTLLFIRENQISDLTPLANLTKLTRLELSDNQISNIKPLVNLTNLTYLGLGFNEISEADKEELRKSLPNCNVWI